MTKSAVIYPVQYARNNLPFRHNIDSLSFLVSEENLRCFVPEWITVWVMIQWLVHKNSLLSVCDAILLYLSIAWKNDWMTLVKTVTFRLWINQCFWTNWLKERSMTHLKRQSLVVTYWRMVNLKYVHCMIT